MAKNSELMQKVWLKRDKLLTGYKGFFKKEPQYKPVFRVMKSENFAADEYYESINDLDALTDMGVEYVLES